MPDDPWREWRAGEVAVIGLGKSGVAAALVLSRAGLEVYASDAGATDATRAAAARLSATGVAVEIGRHDLDRIGRAIAVVASPGVPPSAPPLLAADRRVIVSELEVGLRAMPDLRYIAVTGTNGKTTTTALIEHVLRECGVDAVGAGNIGTPLCALTERAGPRPWVALEASSFQLHDTPSIAPRVGVLTNLSPDHLDRYATVEEYYADKALLFRNAGALSRWVVNGDDARVTEMTAGVRGSLARFSMVSAMDAWFDRSRDTLVLDGQDLLARAEFPLLGDHNVANALAAVLSVSRADGSFAADRAAFVAALRSFRPVPHRLEVVGEFGGVQWINDSKATNVASAKVAIESMRRPTVLLLGGRHKGEPYTSLAGPIRDHCRAVIAYGEARAEVVADLGRLTTVDAVPGTFEDVLRRARSLARTGDAILLAPACSSYDMFNNYEERGQAFAAFARGSAR